MNNLLAPEDMSLQICPGGQGTPRVGGAPANNLFKKVAGQQKGLYAYYVR